MTRLLVVFLALALVAPCLAQCDVPVQKVRDGFTTYVLYASGNICKEGFFGRRELIDNGTGTRMIAVGGGNLFCLKNNGNIWWWRGGMSWLMVDNGTGTAEIWVSHGRVHCRKDNGQVWSCIDPYNMRWQPQYNGRILHRVANFNRLHGN